MIFISPVNLRVGSKEQTNKIVIINQVVTITLYHR